MRRAFPALVVFTMEATKRDLWHKNFLPELPASFIESLLKQQKTVAVTSDKAYKFFIEGYVHEFEGKICLT